MSSYFDFNDFQYVTRSDGSRSKRYRHWCSKCPKDRGYAYKNKILKEPLCHSCKMTDPTVKNKIAINSAKLKHSPEGKANISSGLYKHYGTNKLNGKIANNLRGRLGKAFRGNYKSGSAVKDLGCSIAKLKIKLQLGFHRHPATGEYMTWNNYGRKGWHIDHIKSLCSFNLSDKEQFLIAVHYTNLQPLWARDNLKKPKR